MPGLSIRSWAPPPSTAPSVDERLLARLAAMGREDDSGLVRLTSGLDGSAVAGGAACRVAAAGGSRRKMRRIRTCLHSFGTV